MSRPLRLEAPGEFFHVLARGNNRATIFTDDTDRETFLARLAEVVERHFVRCHAYCLMANHYHLILQPLKANLSSAMHWLNGKYADGFNRRHKQTGHVFQGRFKSLLVERDVYLKELSRYVVLNPVRAGLVRNPENWRWSSYRATVGLVSEPRYLTTTAVLSALECPPNQARSAFRDFVALAKRDDDNDAWLSQLIEREAVVGTSTFVQRFRPATAVAQRDRAYPGRHRHAGRPTLEVLLAGCATGEDLSAAVRSASELHDYTPAEIARVAHVSLSSVSRMLRTSRARKRPAERCEEVNDL